MTEIYLHNLILLSSVASVMSISLHPHRLYIAHQAPLSMGFSRQEYWRELPCPPPEDLPYPRILLRKSHYIHFTDKGIDGIVKLLKFPKAVNSKYGSGLYPQSCPEFTRPHLRRQASDGSGFCTSCYFLQVNIIFCLCLVVSLRPPFPNTILKI